MSQTPPTSDTPQPPPPLELEPVPDPTTMTIGDETDPSPLLPDPFLPLWAYILGGIMLVAAYFILRSFFSSPSTQQDRRAREAFLSAKQSIEEAARSNLSPSETATQLSFALRSYLSKVSNDPTLFQTHEEFILSDKALSSLAEKPREITSAFFEKLAELKYGKSSKKLENRGEICQESADILVNLHSHHIHIDTPS